MASPQSAADRGSADSPAAGGGTSSPLLTAKHFAEPSVLSPENMLREARRQKGVPARPVPSVCVLDPDGDIVRHLKSSTTAAVNRDWACFHTEMVCHDVEEARGGRRYQGPRTIGFVGCAVGAPFAVLVAKQLFASGCELLISISSAGQLSPRCPPPSFIVVERSLRDEGTSHHYAEAETFSTIDPRLMYRLDGILPRLPVPVIKGATWTTDAPFRETASALQAMRTLDLDAVEMEAAALYAFARRRGAPVICLAQISNTLGAGERDFEKGEGNGVGAALQVIEALADEMRTLCRMP